jgi:tRNA-dihydrouridine synthase A
MRGADDGLDRPALPDPLRRVSPRVRLYTEMITTSALIHGDVERHVAFSKEENPVAAQLDGSEPDELAQCARVVLPRRKPG